ncbi:hypothetical protein MF265_21705 [Serratia marcescens]|uniref:hypothetical protein n=1 Tax=Serratia marcescens TaxID=615 RepID=UPI001EF1436F|nr:hypothetical protein [Serratia marcescens]ULH10509.1 hypothetical protein MF265_21705 [Serratia marcescens]
MDNLLKYELRFSDATGMVAAAITRSVRVGMRLGGWVIVPVTVTTCCAAFFLGFFRICSFPELSACQVL